jgi:ketosteroid isomerase-like protein
MIRATAHFFLSTGAQFAVEMSGCAERMRLMLEQAIRELFSVVDARDWEAMPGFFCEDVVYERPGYEAIVGIANLLHFYEHVRIIATGTHYLEQIVIGEHSGSCWGRFIGAKRDGTPLDERFADVYLFKDGKIRQRRSYFFRPAV